MNESEENRKKFCDLVLAECIKARSKHAPMNSCHEGLAVIWEEFEELKLEVFKKEPDDDKLIEEVIQLAAMCACFYDEVI